jgi:AbiV family abortive infection protein
LAIGDWHEAATAAVQRSAHSWALAEGIGVSNHNAARLLEDATLLAKNQRYPSAVALAILAVEESAKAAVLRAMAMCRNEAEMKKTLATVPQSRGQEHHVLRTAA